MERSRADISILPGPQGPLLVRSTSNFSEKLLPWRRNVFERSEGISSRLPYRIHDEELETRLKKAVTQEYVEPIVEHQLPERTQLQKILCDLLKEHSVSAIVCRRISAINLMVALSRRRENRKPHKETPLTSPQCVSPSPEPFPLICEKTQCIVCIGDHRLPYKDRTKRFCRPSKMMDHFEKHVKGVSRMTK